MFQAELKSLQDMASPSFLFAKDLIKHNLVSKTKKQKNKNIVYVARMHTYKGSQNTHDTDSSQWSSLHALFHPFDTTLSRVALLSNK